MVYGSLSEIEQLSLLAKIKCGVFFFNHFNLRIEPMALYILSMY